MKVVLFCGGLGTRLRDSRENTPKPMIPIGGRPVVWHLMNYYSQYGHRDFILCLGYKSQLIKDFFLNYQAFNFSDCVITNFGRKVEFELIGEPREEWNVSLIESGIWHNIGERLWAVRDHLRNEDIFLANYSDGLADVDLDDMIRVFRNSGKAACFLAVRPSVTYHLADIADDGRVRDFRSSERSDIWINGGFFLLRQSIFDYMNEGEELMLEPFGRLIEADQLIAYKHQGFWRAMDTLKDQQFLEDIVEQGRMPWLRDGANPRNS